MRRTARNGPESDHSDHFGKSHDDDHQPAVDVPDVQHSSIISYAIDNAFRERDPDQLLTSVPVVIEVNEFDGASARAFEDQASKAMRSGQTVIPVVIDSFGGQVYSLFRMLDVIKGMQRQGFIVPTVALGKAMSAGAILLAAGDQGFRFAGSEAVVMIHDVWSFAFGKTPDVVASAKHQEYLTNRLLAILDKASGQGSGFWHERLHTIGHGDLFLSSEECLELGLINHIGTPTFDIDVTVKMNFRPNQGLPL